MMEIKSAFISRNIQRYHLTGTFAAFSGTKFVKFCALNLPVGAVDGCGV